MPYRADQIDLLLSNLPNVPRETVQAALTRQLPGRYGRKPAVQYPA